jgi:hypothetical protein
MKKIIVATCCCVVFVIINIIKLQGFSIELIILMIVGELICIFSVLGLFLKNFAKQMKMKIFKPKYNIMALVAGLFIMVVATTLFNLNVRN